IREFERVYQQAGDASLAIMVTGAKTGFEDLQRGRIMIPYHIKLLVVRVVLGEEIRMRQTAGFVELTIGTLEDLPRALRGGLI
ncbi:MAG: hypothetical protein LBE83_09530, partial [Propionibacteriaceae bacterium]|nr:hypothetical protein [Propionibacteriaceae bacterium]